TATHVKRTTRPPRPASSASPTLRPANSPVSASRSTPFHPTRRREWLNPFQRIGAQNSKQRSPWDALPNQLKLHRPSASSPPKKPATSPEWYSPLTEVFRYEFPRCSHRRRHAFSSRRRQTRQRYLLRYALGRSFGARAPCPGR